VLLLQKNINRIMIAGRAVNFLLLIIETAVLMSFKYTPNTLKKMEELFEEARYIIRYEKGHFNSGFCILEERRVVVINKFFNVEGRINALVEILQHISVKEEELSTETLKWYKQLSTDPDFRKGESEQTKMDL
jgi:hypothetical protein